MTHLTESPQFKDEQWMTTADAMAYFLVSSRTLRRWCKQRQILVCCIGGTNYYPKKFIEHMMFLKAQSQFNLLMDTKPPMEQPPQNS